jgi:hypothetical protein
MLGCIAEVHFEFSEPKAPEVTANNNKETRLELRARSIRKLLKTAKLGVGLAPKLGQAFYERVLAKASF